MQITVEQEVNIKSMRIEQLLSEDYMEPILKDQILQELDAILDKTNKTKENEMNKKLYYLQKINDTLTYKENNDRKFHIYIFLYLNVILYLKLFFYIEMYIE